MTEQRDLADERDLETLIRIFYGRCFEDDLLGPIFVDVAHLDLEAHLPIMVDFWSTVERNPWDVLAEEAASRHRELSGAARRDDGQR